MNDILKDAFSQQQPLKLGLLHFGYSGLDNFAIQLLNFIHIVSLNDSLIQECELFRKQHSNPETYFVKRIIVEIDFSNPQNWTLPHEWLNKPATQINNKTVLYFHLIFPKKTINPDCKLLPDASTGQNQNFNQKFFGFSVYFDDFMPEISPIGLLTTRSPRLILENRKPFVSPLKLFMDQYFQVILKEAFKSGYDINVNIAVRLN